MVRRTKQRRRSLPFADWPEADRAAWLRNLNPQSLFDDEDRWSHWAPATRESIQRAYGKWLQHLRRKDPAALELPAGARVTPERLRLHLSSLPRRLAPTTVASEFAGLLIAIRGLAPAMNFDWLQRVTSRLKARAVSSAGGEAQLLHARQLYRLGIGLMESARSYTLATNHRPALTYRDGLLISLLAARPLRLRSMAALRVGQTLIQHGAQYRILLTPDDNKTRRVLEWTVPDHLSGYLREYLDVHRAKLQPEPPVAALWLSEQRRPLSGNAIRAIVKRHARDRLGLNLTPHMFRDVAFTSIALDDPEHVTIGMTLLGHSRIETGERHYNLARVDSAARKHATAISEAAGARRTGRLLNPVVRERARLIMLRANRSARRKSR